MRFSPTSNTEVVLYDMMSIQHLPFPMSWPDIQSDVTSGNSF